MCRCGGKPPPPGPGHQNLEAAHSESAPKRALLAILFWSLSVAVCLTDDPAMPPAAEPILCFAGGRTASDYPGYHQPWDTVDFVHLYVGGRANFEAGLQVIVESGYATVLALDGTDLLGLEEAYL